MSSNLRELRRRLRRSSEEHFPSGSYHFEGSFREDHKAKHNTIHRERATERDAAARPVEQGTLGDGLRCMSLQEHVATGDHNKGEKGLLPKAGWAKAPPDPTRY